MEQVEWEEIPIPLQDYCPISLEEKIVCYADKFYSKTHIGEEKPLDKIKHQLWKHGQDSILRWESLVAVMES
jgi:uncharacterized protein